MEKTKNILMTKQEYQDTIKEFQLLVSWPFFFYRLMFLAIYARHYLDKRYVVVD